VLMLRVVETRDRNQQWLGVADIMRAEAHEEANAVLDRHAARSSSITGVMPQRVIREGDKAQEVLNLIEDDEDIAILVLAAATSRPCSFRPNRPRIRQRSSSCPDARYWRAVRSIYATRRRPPNRLWPSACLAFRESPACFTARISSQSPRAPENGTSSSRQFSARSWN